LNENEYENEYDDECEKFLKEYGNDWKDVKIEEVEEEEDLQDGKNIFIF
jgi:hypothetical protein